MKPLVRLGATAAILAADRVTKLWALDWLAERGSLPLLPFFHLTYVENTGAAFGMGRAKNGFFIVLAAALLIVLAWLQRSWKDKNAWIRWGLVLVAGGAVGNLWDRIAYGFVVDFLDFRIWPVFNVADSCITIGAGCLAWGLHLDDKASAPAKGRPDSV